MTVPVISADRTRRARPGLGSRPYGGTPRAGRHARAGRLVRSRPEAPGTAARPAGLVRLRLHPAAFDLHERAARARVHGELSAAVAARAHEPRRLATLRRRLEAGRPRIVDGAGAPDRRRAGRGGVARARVRVRARGRRLRRVRAGGRPHRGRVRLPGRADRGGSRARDCAGRVAAAGLRAPRAIRFDRARPSRSRFRRTCTGDRPAARRGAATVAARSALAS